jgi:hypothetical protein
MDQQQVPGLQQAVLPGPLKHGRLCVTNDPDWVVFIQKIPGLVGKILCDFNPNFLGQPSFSSAVINP